MQYISTQKLEKKIQQQAWEQKDNDNRNGVLSNVDEVVNEINRTIAEGGQQQYIDDEKEVRFVNELSSSAFSRDSLAEWRVPKARDQNRFTNTSYFEAWANGKKNEVEVSTRP